MDTIAAIATPPGRGGIGIVKISGKMAVEIATSIFRKSSDKGSAAFDVNDFQSHRLYHGFIVDPDRDQVVDEILLVVMKQPHSYTREDVVEIQAHSGHASLEAVLDLVFRKGAVPAPAGEFTRRAFLNGRIDLTQAEAVIDLIHAKSRQFSEMAARAVGGKLKETIGNIRDHLQQLEATVEASIDFPDDVEEDVDESGQMELLKKNVWQPLIDLQGYFENGQYYREGICVAIIGKTNVGKSSILNRLLQTDRAIVSDVPGTTRDSIEASVNIGGFPVTLTDTAGIVKTADKVEMMGISKTREAIAKADIIVFVIDGSRKLSRDDYDVFKQVRAQTVIPVINKSDLYDDTSVADIPESWNLNDPIHTSALTGSGIEHIKERLRSIFAGFQVDVSSSIVPNKRQALLIDSCLLSTREILDGLNLGTPAELLAIDIKEAIYSLDMILGKGADDHVLDRIFGSFCIGK